MHHIFVLTSPQIVELSSEYENQLSHVKLSFVFDSIGASFTTSQGCIGGKLNICKPYRGQRRRLLLANCEDRGLMVHSRFLLVNGLRDLMQE
jgi:hypothetical protein